MAEIGKQVFEEVKQQLVNNIADNRENLRRFEERLYERWHEPIDLYESMVQLAIEFGEKQKSRLGKGKKIISNAKQVALLKIHARSILIAKEILVLLKEGYVDGAHTRWRSLHEIAAISFFLKENEELVSERYLDNSYIKRAVESKDYQIYSDFSQ